MLAPLLLHLFCAHGECDGINMTKVRWVGVSCGRYCSGRTSYSNGFCSFLSYFLEREGEEETLIGEEAYGVATNCFSVCVYYSCFSSSERNLTSFDEQRDVGAYSGARGSITG